MFEQTRYWLLVTLIGSVVFGILVGLNASLGTTRWVRRHCGLHLPHVLDSAWDWKFLKFPESLMATTRILFGLG